MFEKSADCVYSLIDRYYQYLIKTICNICKMKADFPEKVLHYILKAF